MKKYIISFILIILIAFTHTGYAQATFKILNTKDIDMKLTGTSTFHDWEMEASKVYGEAQFIFKTNNEKELISLKSLTFTLVVEKGQITTRISRINKTIANFKIYSCD